jgi:hypothetical protein
MGIHLSARPRLTKLIIARGEATVRLEADYTGNDLLEAGFRTGAFTEVKGAVLSVEHETTAEPVDGVEEFDFCAASVTCDDSKRIAKVTLGGIENPTWDTIRDFTRLMEAAAGDGNALRAEWQYERQAELDLD